MTRAISSQSWMLKSWMPKSWMLKSWMLRSLPGLGLIVIVGMVPPALAQASPRSQPAQPKPLTWQSVLSRLFGRQSQQGASRSGTISFPFPSAKSAPETLFCPVTPITDPEAQRKGDRGPLLSDKPLIAWYGEIGGVKFRNRSTRQEWTYLMPTLSTTPTTPTTPTIPTSPVLDPSVSKKPQPVLNQWQYEGEALLPGQEYEIAFLSKQDPKIILERHRFRTLSAVDRNLISSRLKRLTAPPMANGETRGETRDKKNEDSVLQQVEFLLQQNLINDAQALLLERAKTSPKLSAAIVAMPHPCEQKLAIQAQMSSP